MASTMAVALLRFVLENNQLFAATVLCGSCQHHSVIYHGCAYHGVAGIRDEQYLINLDLLTGFNGMPVDLKRLADGIFVLSSTTFNYCKHDFLSFSFPVPALSQTLMDTWKAWVESLSHSSVSQKYL